MGKINIADLFCGAGGESAGIVSACNSMNMRWKNIKFAAVNHWQTAIETHKLNFPEAIHYCESIQTLDPLDVFGGKERLDLLWASPECTHHSNARGGRPCSDQSRASAWLILKWLSELYCKRVIIENVPEFMNWGPLGSDGRPLKDQKGKTFEAFIKTLQALGYKVDYQLLCAADYGDPTTRKRFFLQAVRGGGKIIWPEATHSENPNTNGQKSWVPARDIIDWTQKGDSIINRKRPLSPKTLARIESGIRKYWGEWAEPFLVVLRGTGGSRDIDRPTPAVTAGGTHLGLVEPFVMAIDNRGREGKGRHISSVHSPLKTITTKNRFGVIEPFLVRYNGDHPGNNDGSNRNYNLKSPIGTLDCSNRYGVVEPFILHQMTAGRSRKVSEPLPTITTQSKHRLVEPFIIQYYGNGKAQSTRIPLATCTTKERFALIEGRKIGLDITFRMLQPHELAAAQGFPKDYKFTGNKGEQVKQIGNAVPVNTAKALALSALGAQ